MQCPNCGRNVRSKTKCAFCGFKFDGSQSIKEPADDFVEIEANEALEETTVFQPISLSESDDIRQAEEGLGHTKPIQRSRVEEVDPFEDDEDFDVIPKTRRGFNFFKVIWGIIKIALLILIMFLLIAFGPKYGKKLWDRYGANLSFLPQQEETTELTTLDTTEIVTTMEATTVLVSAIENPRVNVDEHLVSELTFRLIDASTSVAKEDIQLAVSSNGVETAIKNFVLEQNGSEVKISFSNPYVEVVAAEQPRQQLIVRSIPLNVDETIDVDLPNLSIDREQVAKINEFLSDDINQNGTLSAAIKKIGDDMPFVYADKSINSSQLFAWFVLARVFQAIEAEEVRLESTLQVLDALKSPEDTGVLASEPEGVEYTIDELIRLVVENQDVTAMNHLIQEMGGPNAFNLWLSQNDYFATRVNELLATNEEGHLFGTTTSVKDLATLLEKFANGEIVNDALQESLERYLVQTPITDKFPEELEGIRRRFEIASTDIDSKSQAYAAVLETDEDKFVVVFHLENVKDAALANKQIANKVRQLVHYLQTGEELSLNQEESGETSEESQEIIEEALSQEPVIIEGSASSSSEFQYGADTDGDGLPNTVYDAVNGYYRGIRWTQHADGLFYFEYAE